MVAKTESGQKREKARRGYVSAPPADLAGDDFISGSDDDELHGSSERDFLYGSAGNDLLYGYSVDLFVSGAVGTTEDEILRQSTSFVETMAIEHAGSMRYTLLGPSSDPLIDGAVAAVLARVPEIVHARQEELSQEHIDALVDAYLKSAPTAAARREIEMDNARERARFVEEFPCYTSREVAELAGHEAANASATATRWKKARRIIGLPWKGSDLYPAFQFQEGRPRPVVARAIAALPERMSPWQIAFWLTSSNSWLGGATPLERLDDEEALLAAAGRESEALGG